MVSFGLGLTKRCCLHHMDRCLLYIVWIYTLSAPFGYLHYLHQLIYQMELSLPCRNVMFLPYGHVENCTIWTCVLQSPYGYAHMYYSNMLSNWFYRRYSSTCISSTIWAVLVLSSQPFSYVAHVSLVQNHLLQGLISQQNRSISLVVIQCITYFNQGFHGVLRLI